MPTLMDYVIEGNLTDGDHADFSKEKLAVHAFVQGNEIAKTDVESSGHYKLSFKYVDEKPVTELFVTAADKMEAPVMPAGVKSILKPVQFKLEENRTVAHMDIRIPSFSRHLFGDVIVEGTYRIGAPLVGAKMEFFEEIPHWQCIFFPEGPIIPGGPPPFVKQHWQLVWRRVHAGTTYTQADNSLASKYEIRLPLIFDLAELASELRPPVGPNPPGPPPAGRLIVYIYQFVNGVWKEVYNNSTPTQEADETSPISWDKIPPDGRVDFLIEGENVTEVPILGTFPSSIGLLACDENHIIQGYAYTTQNDPWLIASMSHRPFCDQLAIFGTFPPGLPIVKYKMQIAKATKDYDYKDHNAEIALSWSDLTDPLQTMKRDAANNYVSQVLGPDPGCFYKSVDDQPVSDWLQPGLKFIWNSRNQPDGYYALRLVGYDQNNAQIATFCVPVLRTGNTRPVIDLKADNAGVCGKVVSTKMGPGATINFHVTAHQPDGHLLSCGISATAGAIHEMVTLSMPPFPPGSVPGTGFVDLPETVTVVNFLCPDPLKPGQYKVDSTLNNCDPLSYAFELGAWSAGTDGYSAHPGSQYVEQDLSLFVTKAP